MLWLRIMSAIVGIPLLIWLIYKGGIGLTVALLLLIIIGTDELAKMLGKKGWRPFTFPVIAGELFFVLGAWLGWVNWSSLGLAICFLVLIIFILIKFPNFSIAQLSLSFFVLIYVGWSLTHILLISS